MGKHLNRTQLIHYLEGRLSAEARQQVWQHIRDCNHCYRRLRGEEQLRADLKLEFVGFGKPDDLSVLLPGILTETRRGASQQPFAIMITVFLVVLTIFPLLPHLSHTTYAHDTDLLNVPHATGIPVQNKVTVEAEDSDSEFDDSAFNMEYASPAPYPQATVGSSPMPNNHSE
ncbi:MAG: hypothetical protein K8I82_25190 [Anaerolineae bacterium]|nr:hypothetical protein [Anaerolineae bacterium]